MRIFGTHRGDAEDAEKREFLIQKYSEISANSVSLR